jgi:oxygen-dependent protoporphyrinogen oxidase
MNSESQVAVIGGGISGLICAWRLQQKGLSVRLIESAPRCGGVIATIEQDGFRFDIGPQSFSADAPLLQLIHDLNLDHELLQADSRAPRYILHKRRLVAAPLSPPQLLSTPLFGWRTKLRLLSEPLRTTRPPQGDESIAAFMRRKFGEDLLSNLVGPFVSGVYAGDPERLSLPSAFPLLRRAEERSGSVIRGAIKLRGKASGPGPRRKSKQKPVLSNFRRGISALTEALASQLGSAVFSGAKFTTILRTESENGMRFKIAYRGGDGATTHTFNASTVVIATPTREAAHLLAPIEPRFEQPLMQIEYAAVVQVGAGYRLDQVADHSADQPLRGFGFLVPRTEHLRLLGTVWNSALFPDRAPEGKISFTSFLGGATDPEVCNWSDDRIAETAHAELAGVLGIGGPPLTQHVARWQRAIPQYNLGHRDIVAALDGLCAAAPGIFLVGNYLSGPSLPSCVEHANKIAEDVSRLALQR